MWRSSLTGQSTSPSKVPEDPEPGLWTGRLEPDPPRPPHPHRNDLVTRVRSVLSEPLRLPSPWIVDHPRTLVLGSIDRSRAVECPDAVLQGPGDCVRAVGQELCQPVARPLCVEEECDGPVREHQAGLLEAVMVLITTVYSPPFFVFCLRHFFLSPKAPDAPAARACLVASSARAFFSRRIFLIDTFWSGGV